MPERSDQNIIMNIEQKKNPKRTKVLIVEDQGYPQFILLKSLQSGFADQIENFANGQDVLIIDNYQDALKLLEDENFDYQIVLLDNRVNIESIPIDKRGRPIKIPIQGVKPDAFQIYDDPEDYSDYPKTDAYNLIGKFKEKGATVIGTSSMSQEELKRKNLPTPDFQINKLDSEEMLANIKEELMSIETNYIEQPKTSNREIKVKKIPEMLAYNDRHILKLMKTRGMLKEDETPGDAFLRAVDALAKIEVELGAPPEKALELKYFILDSIDRKQIVLGTPIITNAGQEGRPTSACAIIPVDLKNDISKIKEIITPYFALGMGSGFDFSSLSDPVKKLKDLNNLTKEIEKYCERPVASMGSLRVDHPKIFEFITSKKNDDFLEWRFNISINCDSNFMQAVEEDSNWPLKDADGNIIQVVKAKGIFKEIVESAHYCGEPGILFMERFEKDNPVPEMKYHGVAPCAEVGMAPGEVCQFSYINISEIVKKNSGQIIFDFDRLVQIVRALTRALDNSVEISTQNAISNSEIIKAKRRIGVGICGTADLLMKLELEYDSQKARDLMADVVSTVNYYSKDESIQLAKERGSFPLFDKSRYIKKEWALRFKKNPTKQVTDNMWESLWNRMSQYGLRNSGTTAIPPTGTSSRLIDTSASIEPRFSIISNSGDILPAIKRDLEAILRMSGCIDQKAIDDKIREMKINGSFQNFNIIPDEKRRIWKIAGEISVSGHLKMIEIIQPHIDESISKTFNLPLSASVDDVDYVFNKSYQSGLKGATVFRDGCLGERN